MNAKKVITIVLLLFVVAAVGTLVIKSIAQDQTSESSTQTETPAIEQNDSPAQVQTVNEGNQTLKPDANVDVVYYFMTTQRCPSCMKIEAYTNESVHKNFTEKIESDKLVWKMVNVDEPENRHFIKDYQLYTKSVVLVRYRDGKQVKWKNLDQVWNLLGDKTAFHDYIAGEVKAFLEDKS